MKGFYSLVVGTLVLISTALSAQPLSVMLESGDAPVGQTLCLDLTGDDFNDVSGFQFSLNYDPAILEFSSATGTTLVGQPVFIQNSAPGDLRVSWNTFGAIGIVETDPFLIGQICFTILQDIETLVVFSDDPIVTEFLGASGNNITEFTTIPATINAGGVGTPTCSDGIQNGNETGIDCGGPDCPACPTCSDGIQNGNETGIDCGGPDCPNCPVGGNDLLFFMSSGSGSVGTEVCLNVTTQNFTAIGGFQYTINYDPAVVAFTQATNLAFVDLSVVQPAAFPGQIRVSWNYFQPNTDGETLANNAVVFSICFEVLEVTGTDVVFSGNPIGIEGFDGEGNNINVVLSNGTINGGGVLPNCSDGIQNGNETGVDCGGPDCMACPPSCSDGIQNGDETGVDCGGANCAPCPPTGPTCTVNPGELTLCVDEICDAEVGDQVCIDLEVTNFTEIVGFEFKVIYPAANLDFVSGTSNMALLGGATLTNPTDGEVRALWFDPSPQFEGATIANTAFLVNLCFTVQNTATSPVTVIDDSFSNQSGEINPVAIFNGSVNSANCGGVVPTCNDGIQNGNETGVDCGGPDCAACPPAGNVCTVNPGELTVCVDEVCDAQIGDQICLDIDVTNFTSVVGFEFKVIYPGANLNYNSGTSNPALLGGATINNPNDGEVRVLWFDPSPQFEGATIAGTASLVNLCFTVESAAASPISLIDESFSNQSGEINPIAIYFGGINEPGCNNAPPTCNDGIQNGNETGVDCGGPDCAACPPAGPVCTVNPGELTMCVDEVCDAEVGDEVCLDFEITNFTEVVGFEFKVIYPGANLDYSSGTSNPLLLGGATINNNNDGEVRVLWFDPSPQFEGATIPGTDVLITLCFTVESTATSSVTVIDESFSNQTGVIDPTVIFNGSINGADCGGVTPTCNDGIQNGNETGVDCGGPDCAACPVEPQCTVNEGELTICVDEVCAEVGEQVCVDFDVTNFVDIVGFEFKVAYPAGALDYVPGSATSNAALLGGVTVSNPSDGELRFLWFDPTPTFEGATIPGTEAMVNVCFTVETAVNSPLTVFDDSFNDVNGPVDPYTIFDGSVNGAGCGTPQECNFNGVQDGLETGVDCGGPLCPPCTTGQGDLTINVSSATVNVGDQACLDVTVQGFNDIRLLDLTLNFNQAALQVSSVITTSQLPNFNISNFTIDQASGTINVDWTGNVGAALNDNTVLFRVCFTALNEATTNVTFDGASNALDGTGNQVTLVLNGGTVNATNNFQNLAFVMGSGSGPVNSQVCLDLLAYNFTDITSFSFTINYDPLQLSFNELLANQAFPPGGSYQVTNPDPGEIRVIWLYNPPDFAGITVPDGTSAGQVCFDVIIACEAPVQITGSAVDIAATDNNGNSLDVTTVDGAINAGIICDGGPTAENLIIDIQNGNGLAGEEVCVDVLVTNFISIDQLSFTLNYDASVLTFSGVQNFGLASITPANFVVGPAGTITFQWDSPSNLGQTIANGGTMFSLCFIVDDVVQTPINFSATPVNIAASNGAGANVGVIVNNGMINPNAPVGDDLTLVMCCVDGNVGDVVDINVKAYNFVDIIGFQFSVNYDPTKLQFISDAGNNALDFLFITNTVPGELRVQWADNGGMPNTLPDGTILTGFRFEILDAEAATVVFSNMPIGAEFIDANGIVPVTFINCAINGSGAPEIVEAAIQQPTCSDDTDGSITLTVTGPTNVSYNWIPNPSASTGPVLENLGPGTYMVQVINNDTGESTTESFTVTAPPPLNVSAINIQNVSCTGDANGLISLAISGGVTDDGTYLIDWSGNLQDNLLQQTGLDGGLYSVTVTDDNGCMRTLNFEILEPNSLPAFNGLVTDIGDVPGSINVTVVAGSGTPGYTFEWTGPGGFTANTEDLAGLTEPGLYCLTMTDDNGCGVTNCFEVNASLRITEVNIIQGCIGELGAIDITVAGGDGNFVFAWTGPNGFTASTEDIAGIEPGFYSVTVTSGSESITANYTLEEGAAITATATITQATAGNNGAIDLMPSGGSQPYEYLWSNGETTQDLMGLEVGEYCVTITDSQACESAAGALCFEVTAEALAVVSTSTTTTTCFDSQDGTATVVVNNGLAPFTATTVPGGFTASSATDTLVFDLPGGSYTITIVDALNNTITTNEVIVSAPAPVTLQDTIIVSDADDGSCAGSITINPVGGTAPYDIDWNVGLSGPQITGLCAGLYAATVVDANGCTFEFADIEVLQVSANGVVSNASCEGSADGAVNLTINSGIPPYNFAWRRVGQATVIATTEDLANLTAGVYEVVVTDGTGQSFTLSFTVSTSPGFSLTTTVTSDYNGNGVSCNGNTDGSARVDVSGFGDFNFQWFSGATVVGTDSILTGVGAGTYVVVATSESGCIVEDSVTLSEPMALSITPQITNVSCFDERDGRITLAVNGGTPPYSYEWSNGGTLNQIQFLQEGNYEVFINDANGCTFNQSFMVDGPPELLATVESTDATEGCNGSVTVIPLTGGGSANFNYTWRQLPMQGNNPVALNLCPGDYLIDVFDENRCQTVTVTATVRDRRFPCLSERNVITPNGDGLNESFILFCTDGGEINNNNLEIYNRWGQLVYQVANYNCSTDGGLNCFEGRTNDGSVLPAGPYYYVLDYTNPIGEAQQKRGSITIVLE